MVECRKSSPNETELVNNSKNSGLKISSKIKDLFPVNSPIKLKKGVNLHKANATTTGQSNKIPTLQKQNKIRKAKASNKIKDLLLNNAQKLLAESINYEVQERENNIVTHAQSTVENTANNRIADRQVLKINNFYSNQLDECSKSEKISSLLLNSVDKNTNSNEAFSHSNENKFSDNNNSRKNIQSKAKRMNSNQIRDLLKNELVLVKVKRKRVNKCTKISNLLNTNLGCSN